MNKTIYSFKFFFVPSERPWFKNLPKKSVAEAQGQSAVLHCRAAGDPKPELKWRKDGVPLESSKRIIFHSKKEILFLKQLRREDSGLYQCLAWNIVGNVTSTTNINVFGMFYQVLYTQITDKIWVHWLIRMI